jgi:hypothetical protein
MGFSLATESAQAQAQTNIALFMGDVQNYHRLYVTDVRILPGLPGSELNAGILVNYSEPVPPSNRYHLALLNLANSTFGFYFFNGLTLVPVGAAATIPELQVGDWYRIRLQVRPSQALVTQLQVVTSVTGVTNPAITASIATNVGANMWDFSASAAGLYARRSRVRFSFWHADFVS